MTAEAHSSPGVEEAFELASRLRGDPRGINQDGWRDEPSDPMWSVKVYDGGRRIQLAGAAPWWLPAPVAEAEEDIGQRLGSFLFHSVGITRVRWQPGGTVLSSPQRPGWVWPTTHLDTRRPIPSGGAMYPTEVYVIALEGPIGPGVFHYDPARHELTDLGHRAAADALRSALGLGADEDLAPWTLVLAQRFSKNMHKYGNFAYRLGAVDLGVALGRLTAGATEMFGDVEVRVDFDDAAVNTMCGLDSDEESAYALVAFGTASPSHPSTGDSPGDATRQTRPVIPVPPPVLERGRPARISEELRRVHSAACRPSAAVRESAGLDLVTQTGTETQPDTETVLLPAALPGSISDRRQLLCRTSNGPDFTGAAISAEALATVLQRSTEAIERMHAVCRDDDLPGLRLFCAIDEVDDVPAGWYRYEPASHALIATGALPAETSPAAELQQTLYTGNVDLERSSLTLHVATIVDFRADHRGARAYRIQQLLVGTAIEAVAHWSAAAGAGSHPLLGFNAGRVDELYSLGDDPYGVQALVTLGVARATGNLEGSVIS